MKTPSDDEIRAWFANKEFTTDWVSGRFKHWCRVLKRFRDEPVEILEIGSFEGRSAIFFLEFMPKARITCIDIFRDAYEARFDRNMAPYAGRLRKIKSPSVGALEMLLEERKKFDAVYVDGDHSRHGTFANTIGSWPLLKVGGVLIWDDYQWKLDQPSATRPEDAIDLFCAMFDGCFRELHRAYQVSIEKTAEWPESRKQPEKKSLGRDLKELIRRHAPPPLGRKAA